MDNLGPWIIQNPPYGQHFSLDNTKSEMKIDYDILASTLPLIVIYFEYYLIRLSLARIGM